MRWSRLLPRDEALGREIETKRITVKLVPTSSTGLIPQLLRDYFNISISEYTSWVNVQKESLIRPNRVDSATPPLFNATKADFVQRSARLDKLRELDFPGNFVTNEEGQFIDLQNMEEIDAHFENCDYKFQDRQELQLVIRQGYGRKIRCRFGTPSYLSRSELRFAINQENDHEEILLEPGILSAYINDPGLHAVLQTENSLLEDLEHSFLLNENTLNPARIAWEMIMDIMEGDNFKHPNPDTRGQGFSVKELSKVLCEECFIEKDVLKKLLNEEGGWHIINGAPGTGKTTRVCNVVANYLKSVPKRTFPPPRILVVANTHWALKNFTDKFMAMFPNEHSIMREFPRFNAERLIAAATIDEVQLAFLDRHYKSEVLPQLPPIDQGDISTASLLSVAQELSDRQYRMDQRNNSGCGTDRVVFGQHEEWRILHGFMPFEATDEYAALSFLIKRLATQVEATIAHEVEVRTGLNAIDVFSAAIRGFEADIVITTVDGVSRLPDMGFSLVVFEEASQINLIGLLKVLAKVIRANLNSVKPSVVLSGDPMQLPPYESNQLIKAIEKTDLNFIEINDIFPLICKTNRERQSVLSVQYRMHRSIGKLVQAAFYYEQEWKYPKLQSKQDLIGPWWYDSGSSKDNVDQIPPSKSWYNPVELDIVENIVKHFNGRGLEILVVTPYVLQMEKLRDRLPESVRVRTIDGCQGIEADVVVISFVQFGTEFASDFRRINVAISRSKSFLFCVGNFEGLLAVSRKGSLARLGLMFSKNGEFRNKRINSDGWYKIVCK